MSLDDLLREALAAPDDDARARAAAQIAAEPDAIPQITAKLMSSAADQRTLALHFVTRLAPPPAQLAPGVIHCLRSPLDPDPLGDETALVLLCCGALAAEVIGFRDVLAERVHAIDRAEGPRAPVMRRLAHDTLAALDRALAASKQRWAAMLQALVDLVSSGDRDGAAAEIERQTVDDFYPELGRAARWEELGDRLDRAGAHYCYERAHACFAEHASYATAGGEGLARMLDVDRLAAKLEALKADR